MAAPKSARPILPGAGKPIQCQTCGRRLVDKRSLKQHVAAAHPAPEVGVSEQHANGEARR